MEYELWNESLENLQALIIIISKGIEVDFTIWGHINRVFAQC